MKKIASLFIVFALLSCTTAPQPLDSTDKVMLCAAYTTLAVDMLQTVEIVTNPIFTELNPIIAGLASISPFLVPAYFIGIGIAVYKIAKNLKSPYRKAFLGTLIALETGTIINNFNIGAGP